MTITLQYVQMILGLPVDGLPITGRVEQDYDALCLTLLGFPFPENNKTGGWIQIHQLSRWFPNLPNNVGDVEVHAMQERTSYNFLEELYLQTSLTILFTSRIYTFRRILRRQENTVGVVQLWLTYIDNCVLPLTMMEQRLQVQ
ncbi:hypothetical protein Scep_011774 [Stephania cephalantha]|uniref:Uncharacterized protein n=1 Tax=Stephania cephalantha TaxID=152367 RepID=A0AAP0JDR8_9MAGN